MLQDLINYIHQIYFTILQLYIEGKIFECRLNENIASLTTQKTLIVKHNMS